MIYITCPEDILNPSEDLVIHISRSVYYYLDYTEDELKLLMTSYINKAIFKTLGQQPPDKRAHYLLDIDKSKLLNQALEHYRLEKLDELL